MKKMILAVAVIGCVTVLTSCKKDYVCTCSGTVLGIPYSGADTTLVDMSKKDAETKCSSFDWTVGTDSQTCELK
ncbi:MAG: hypothetical protein IPM77_09470 [Crocinitomicaceae bacterium]|nr:hypothetical protein [Crocinitomicaceae bacterium]